MCYTQNILIYSLKYSPGPNFAQRRNEKFTQLICVAISRGEAALWPMASGHPLMPFQPQNQFQNDSSTKSLKKNTIMLKYNILEYDHDRNLNHDHQG